MDVKLYTLIICAGALLAGAILPGCQQEAQVPEAAEPVPEIAETAAEEPEWDVVLDERTGQVMAADAVTEVRGAPLGGARNAPEMGQADLYVEDPQTGELIRNIPQEAFHSVAETEAALGMHRDELKFDTTPDGKHFKVTFGQLGCYMYEMPDPTVLRDAADPHALLKDQIPAEIKALDNKPVVLLGFMVPVAFDQRGRLTAFAITQNQAFCCYGVTPAMNDWVMVTMADGQSVEYRQQEPVAVYGDFEVGEELDEGYVLSLYRLRGQEVTSIQQLLRRTATS